ncbi:MAG: ABC transporter substrate-binding protein [Rhodocyclales bacterium]|nr:ABC transporter substrate-binding protein [Rhodocyclales bacterium]
MRRKLLASLSLVAGLAGSASTIPAAAAIPAAPSAASGSRPAPAPLGAAQDSAPDALLSAATAVVIARLKDDDRPNATTTVAELMETTIAPLFDFRHMTQLAVARNWKLASAEQQDSLVPEFKVLLVRTYSAALVNFRDEVIDYKPLSLTPGASDVTVKSTVKKPGVERMSIDYDMERMTDGWKVYDIRVAGISLTTTYRSSFAEIIREGGVDTLIRYLVAKNRQARAGPRSDDSEARGLILLYGVAPSLLRGHR